MLAIIGLLAGLVGPRVLGHLSDSKVKAARIQIDGFAAALDLFHLDNGRYPTSAEGLAALVQKPDGLAGWNGPYLKKAVPRDPWGEPYKYRCCPGQHGDYDIWSEGADKAPGGEGENADVLSWDAEQR